MAEDSWILERKFLHTFIAGDTENSLYLIRHMQFIGDLIEFLSFVLAAKSLIVYSLSYSCFSCLLECNGFPYQGDKINEWFVQKFRSEDGKEHKVVNVINVNQEGRRMDSYRTQGQAENFPDCLLGDDYEVFFHGTKHSSAQDIVEGGINLNSLAERSQDFSDGEGYYVFISFDEALVWAWEHFSPLEGRAVLIYRVHKEQLRGENNDKGLDLREDKQEWLRVVREYRRPDQKPNKKCNKKINKQLRKEIKKHYDFVEGPRASNNQPPTECIGTYQLCVRNANCAQVFNNSLHSVVFFKD